MIKNFLLIAWRKLQKQKLYTGINVLGLSIGIAACLLIGIYITHELSYDKFNTKADRIVRVTMEYGASGTVNTTASTGTKVGPALKRNFPAVEEYVRTFLSHNTVKADNQIFEEPRILYADEPFFKIFSFRLLKGDAATALDAPDKIVISEAMAKKYFGDADPLNKILVSGGKDLRVSAVCENVPENSQVKFDFVTQFLNLGNGVKNETWWNANWFTYLLVHNKDDIPQLQAQVDNYMQSATVRQDAGMEGNGYLKYHLEPLTKVHLYSSLAGLEPNGNIRYIYIFAIVALLILFIAGANYTNLATAQSINRSGEIGMRKVMGASRPQIFLQFIGESLVVTFIAALLALVISIVVLPLFNNVSGKTFTYHVFLKPIPIASLLLFSVFVGFLTGLYPGLILSGTKTLGVLKKGFSFTGNNNFLRKVLITVQFGISVFLICYTATIMQQMHYMQTKNIGYEKDHVLVLPIGGKMQQNFLPIKNALKQVQGVESVTASYETPEYVEWGDGITAIDEKGKHEISLNAMPIDLDFTSTMKMQMAAGRDFNESDFALMDTSNNSVGYQQPYLINETLAKRIGWTPEQAIGKSIEKNALGPVVGVVKDFHFSSFHEPIGPLLLFLGRDYSRVFLVRINGQNIQQTIASLDKQWKQWVPDRPFTYHFLDDDYNKLYQSETRSAQLFSAAAALTILLACFGLFGLAAFTTVQRTKEIGIRRVLGATITDITMLVSGSFIQLVAIAAFIAIPLAWWAMNKWLEDFSYRVPVNWWVFALTAAGAMLIAFVTVGLQALRTTFNNPVKSLRIE